MPACADGLVVGAGSNASQFGVFLFRHYLPRPLRALGFGLDFDLGFGLPLCLPPYPYIHLPPIRICDFVSATATRPTPSRRIADECFARHHPAANPALREAIGSQIAY